jgi:hypothetical protein
MKSNKNILRIQELNKLIKEAEKEQRLSNSDIFENWIKDAYKEIEELKSKEKKC